MEEKKKFIVNVLYYAAIVAIAYLILKYLMPACVPFIMGMLIAYLGVKFSKKVFKKDNKAFKSISLVIVYLVILLVVSVLLSYGILKIVDFFKSVPSLYKNVIEPYLTILQNNIANLDLDLPASMSDYLVQAVDSIFDSIKSLVLSVSATLVSFLTAIIAGAPNVLINITIMIVSSFYFAFDYERIIAYANENVNKKAIDAFYSVKDFIENKLFKIVKSYAIIMFITFVELSIGLSIFGINNSIILSLLIALLDILPILGVGTVLIPWGIICIIVGSVPLGIGLLVLYLIITFIRQIIEPKFVGSELGLHPLAALILMIIGLRLFGGLGMIGLPVLVAYFLNKKKK